nr:acyl-CoA dehydrogenase family member 11-like [Lytechinus pictus]
MIKDAISEAVRDALREKVRCPTMPHPLPSLQATPSSLPTSSTPTSFLPTPSPPPVRKSDSPDAALSPIEDDLDNFGERVGEEIEALGNQCEENPPYVKHFDAWGNRVDDLITCEAWKKQKAIAAEEGIVAIPYERKYGSWSRVYQAAKMILYGPSSGLYSCPLAMTDGAAKIFENDSVLSSELQRSAFGHLTSRKPETFWTSGQWMTEKKGGSDVAGGTETLAYPQNDGSFNLHGYKWFSSATDSDMTLTLARIVDDDGQYKEVCSLLLACNSKIDNQ